jgi:hypothetical protein
VYFICAFYGFVKAQLSSLYKALQAGVANTGIFLYVCINSDSYYNKAINAEVTQPSFGGLFLCSVGLSAHILAIHKQPPVLLITPLQPICAVFTL